MRTSPGMLLLQQNYRIFANTHRPLLKSVSDKLCEKPVLGLVGGIMEDYQYLWDNYYFASATL